MDAVAGLLDGPRARGAFLLRSLLDPPWSMRIEDEAPLCLVAITRGEAWLLPDDGEAQRLRPGDVAVLRGPDRYTLADDPKTAPQVVIHPGQRCTTPDGGELSLLGYLGVRTWGNSPQGSTVMLNGTYELQGEVSRRLLQALPGLLVLPGDAWQSPLLGLLAEEIVKDDPGQEAVLDRLLDLLLIAVLRAWFAGPEAAAPAWYRAYGDPVVGHVLRLIHNDPAGPWTVARLAAETGVSRAAHARGEGGHVVGAVVMLAVDEERGGAGHPARVGAAHVLVDALGVLVVAELLVEAVDVESELQGVAPEVTRRELVLVGKQQIVHLPERALRGGRLGGLGRDLGSAMHVVQREMAPHVAQVVAERQQQLAHHDLGLAAVGALVVAVLHERHRRVLGAADVVALGVDVLREVHDLVLGARDLARADGGGQVPDQAERARGTERRHHRGGQHAELGLLELAPVEGEARDQERHGEPDACHRAGARDHRPAERTAQPQRQPHGERRRAHDPQRLAHHVAEEDAERDRGADRVRKQSAVDVDARVGEREQRDDHEARPRVERVLETIVG